MSESEEVQQIMDNEGEVESESNSEIVVEPESTPEEPESTPEEPESTPEEPESTPEEPESTPEEPESTPEEPESTPEEPESTPEEPESTPEEPESTPEEPESTPEEPESTPEEPESTPEEPESTPEEPESTPEEPESTPEEPESSPEEPESVPEEITEEEREQRRKSIDQRIAELDYLVELAGQWASREINRDGFIELWENRNVSVNESTDYESKLSEFEKMPEIIQKWNQGLNMRINNHFKNLAGYSLEKRLFSDDTSVEEKVTTLEKLETLLVKCAKLEYVGKIGELNDYIDSFY